MVRVTQHSKVRNDPLGSFSPYGASIGHRPGEYAQVSAWAPTGSSAKQATPASHRTPPVMPRSHFIGVHLQMPPKATDPLEERAMRRAVQQEARSRRSERRLAEVEAELAKHTGLLIKRDLAIQALKAELVTMRHALDVAQSRVWKIDPTPPTYVTYGQEARFLEASVLGLEMAGRQQVSTAPDVSVPSATALPPAAASTDDEWNAVTWFNEQLRPAATPSARAGGMEAPEHGIGRLVAESLLHPLLGDDAEAHAQRLVLKSFGKEGSEEGLADALRDGGLAEKVAHVLMPLMRELGAE